MYPQNRKLIIKFDKSMKKVRAAIVGYGNIGHYVLQALQAAPDFEIAGVVRRAGAENRPAELNDYPVVKDIKELESVDVAILCTPTRSVEKYAKEILALGIHTVDSFDIHTGIADLRRTLDAEAKAHNTVSIISAGWDPGSDSVVRTLLEAISAYTAGGYCSERHHVYQLRTGYEYGAHGSCESHRRCEGCFVHDDSYRYGHSSSYGVHRTERGL